MMAMQKRRRQGSESKRNRATNSFARVTFCAAPADTSLSSAPAAMGLGCASTVTRIIRCVCSTALRGTSLRNWCCEHVRVMLAADVPVQSCARRQIRNSSLAKTKLSTGHGSLPPRSMPHFIQNGWPTPHVIWPWALPPCRTHTSVTASASWSWP